VLGRALAKAPRERFASAPEMAQAMREARAAGADDVSATPLRVPRVEQGTPTLDGAAPTKRVDATEDMPEVKASSVPATPGRSASWNAPLAARRRGAAWYLVPAGVLFVAAASSLLITRMRPPAPTASMAAPPATIVVPASAAPASIGISHEPVGCLIAGEFPLIEAAIVRPADVEGRVFFKSNLGDDYYFIRMTRVDGRLVGKLPKPKLEASPISYYIAVSPTESSRTPEYSAVVVNTPAACQAGRRVARIGPKGAVTVFSTVGGDLVFSLKDAFGVEDLIALLSDPDAGVRERAAASLGQLGPVASQAISAAVRELKSPDSELRARAASDLATTGRRLLRQVTSGLVESLKDKAPEVRMAAAQALGEIGPGFATAVAALREALKDQEAKVRTTAADALGSMGSVLASALAALEDASKNETDKRVEKAADAALERIRGLRAKRP